MPLVKIERLSLEQYRQDFRFILRSGPYLRIPVGFTGNLSGTTVDSAMSFFFCKHVLLAAAVFGLALSIMMIESALCLPLWPLMQ